MSRYVKLVNLNSAPGAPLRRNNDWWVILNRLKLWTQHSLCLDQASYLRTLLILVK